MRVPRQRQPLILTHPAPDLPQPHRAYPNAASLWPNAICHESQCGQPCRTTAQGPACPAAPASRLWLHTAPARTSICQRPSRSNAASTGHKAPPKVSPTRCGRLLHAAAGPGVEATLAPAPWTPKCAAPPHRQCTSQRRALPFHGAIKLQLAMVRHARHPTGAASRSASVPPSAAGATSPRPQALQAIATTRPQPCQANTSSLKTSPAAIVKPSS